MRTKVGSGSALAASHALTRVVELLVAFALLLVGFSVAQSAVPARAATAQPKRLYSGWIPYWTVKESLAAFTKNADLFSDVSPFFHDARSSSKTASGIRIVDNDVSYSTQAAVIAQLKGHGAAVLPSITDGSGRLRMAATVRNPTTRAALVDQITNLVTSRGYDGIDLDFETFAFTDGSSSWAATRPAWVAFVKALATSLHAREKMLSLAVPPIYDSNRRGSSGYWVYDFVGVGPYVDKLRIMAYDYSWDSPGPIGGPMSWAEKVAEYAAGVMPASKVQLGTPTYGRDWVKSKSGSGCPSVGQKVYDSNQRDTAVAGVNGSQWKRDSGSLERYLNYTVTYNHGTCTVRRGAWLPDATTTLQRVRIANNLNLSGIAVWTVGAEEEELWAPMRQLALGAEPTAIPKPSPKVQSARLTSTKLFGRAGQRVRLAGTVSPVRANVRVKIQRFRGGRWQTKRTVRTNPAGMFSLLLHASKTVGVSKRMRVVLPAQSAYQRSAGPHFTLRAT